MARVLGVARRPHFCAQDLKESPSTSSPLTNVHRWRSSTSLSFPKLAEALWEREERNGHEKYYDDNAWLVISFFEAYELTHNPRYRRRAEDTLDFVPSGWDESVLGGGIWWHEAQ